MILLWFFDISNSLRNPKFPVQSLVHLALVVFASVNYCNCSNDQCPLPDLTTATHYIFNLLRTYTIQDFVSIYIHTLMAKSKYPNVHPRSISKGILHWLDGWFDGGTGDPWYMVSISFLIFENKWKILKITNRNWNFLPHKKALLIFLNNSVFKISSKNWYPQSFELLEPRL